MYNLKKFTTSIYGNSFTFSFDLNDKLKVYFFIGENGTGKSFILAKLSEALRLTFSNLDNSKVDYFELEFINQEGDILKSIYHKKSKIGYLLNQDKISYDKFKENINMKKVFPISFLISDKFNNSPNTKSEYYEYLGLRQNNAIFVGTVERRIVNGILSKFENTIYRQQVKNILEFIGREPEIKITYETTIKTLVDAKRLTIATPKERVKKQNLTDKYPDSLLKDLIEHINQKKKMNEAGNSKISYKFNFETGDGINSIKFIKMLSELNYIGLPTISIEKNKNSNFDFASLSSGEINILYTLINIATHAQDGAIFLIDEPELSLHPKWQIEYINILRKILNETNCDVFIASHSHLMVADLKEIDSQIFAFNKGNNAISIDRVEYSPYAWNSETILYRIFKTRSFSNTSIKYDIVQLLSLCNNKTKIQDNKEEIQKYINNLKSISLDESDPLIKILNDAQEQINVL